MRRVVLAALALLSLSACAGNICWSDNSGVERSPWSGPGPYANKAPTH